MSVYIHLFHGRKDPDADLDDWGDDGPTLGPFGWVHTTYVNEIKLGGLEGGDNVGSLRVANDMVYYDGVWYGDWSVFSSDKLLTVSDQRVVDSKKTEPPGTVKFNLDGQKITEHPSAAWAVGDEGAEAYRRRRGSTLAKQKGCLVCTTCYATIGEQREDNGLTCGVHCQPCFDELVSECRKQSF